MRPLVRGRRRLVIVVVIVFALTGAACGSDGNRTNEPSATGRGWVATAPFERPDRIVNGMAPTIWTGTEVIIAGGLLSADQGQFMESPAYNPSSGLWRAIAAPPVLFIRDQTPSTAVWSGSELLLFGPTVPVPTAYPTEGYRSGPIVGAAYNPSTDTWRDLASPPPDYYRLTAAVWTGNELLTWTQGVGVATFDPSTDVWTSVPTEASTGPSFAIGDAPAIWDGAELVVFGGYSGEAAAFDPTTQTWTTLPSLSSGVTAAAATNDGLLGFDSDSGVIATLDASQVSWVDGAPAPFKARATRTTAWTGEAFAVWAGIQFDYSPTSAAPTTATDGATYDPGSKAWTPMPSLPDQDVQYIGGVWAGDVLFTWGGAAANAGLVQAATLRP